MKTKLLLLNLGLVSTNFLSIFSMGHDWHRSYTEFQHKDFRSELLEHVKNLIKNKKDLSIRAKGCKRPPIIEACLYGYKEIVELLLQNGEKPDRKFLGDSCLHVATFYGYLETVKILLKYEANIFVTNDRGLTPIHIGKLSKNKKIREFFENLLQLKRIEKETLFIDAVDKNNVGLVEFLLGKGQNPNVIDQILNKPVIYTAVLLGHTKIVELLVIYGAKTDFVDPLTQKNLVDFAKHCGNGDIVKIVQKSKR
ncbi:ankyrin repeat domain-containing protein [Candidatus Dependentiae bacterium]|nr:ankyrin repeat domain-containing protein [Candidatus Dependentiae bacterium]